IEQLLFGGDTTAADTAAEGMEPPQQDGGGDGQSAGDAAQDEETTPEETGAQQEAEAGAEAEELAFRPFTSLLNQGDFPGTYLVAVEDVPTAQLFMDLPAFQRALPRNIRLHWDWQTVALGAREYRRLYVLEEDAFLTGDMLENATAGRDVQFNQAQVQFELTRAGGRRFSDITGQHIGDNIAIVLDNEVVSAPTVRDRIGARGQIDMGQAPLEEARDLALVLRAGALPAPLQIMEERTVGPSLGQDSIEQGELAGIVGLILVVVVMIGYYRMAGALAVGALIVYVAMVLGGLSALNATLTVPGIAGLILSVGMAVDANVLIFERIREELEAGRATRKAVDEGFAHALSAIVDANLTTLITALILFQFGTGPVRGFAVTLSIGIVASFFSALYVTRTFFLIYLRGKKATDPISV
ncbi:MAG: protein translocase subunit SecD, partial [Longimicrobiales bacterium]|nr:protein translocase subunit SecD [Longimicrobiales bacterium]